ncbi:MAG: PilZ domain-containing protein [Chloroflexota bacterium]|nr:PilZ domain-containing protein [Dehalococcoidia bacterium]MDW8254276.1 PilZ domain-containing protein [Chloroflexota bacterium]
MNAAVLNLAWVKPNMPAKVAWTEAEQERVIAGLLGDCYTDRVALWLPECRDPAALPRPGETVSLRIPLDNGLYVAPCRVETAPVLYSLGASLHLRVTGAPERLQRRQFRRVRVNIVGMPATRLDEDDRPAGELVVDILDIGGGGMRFRTSESLAAGDRLAVSIQLLPDQLIRAVATVLAPGEEPGHYRSRFSRIAERDVQRIVQFVFMQEVAERRKTTAQDIRARFSAIPARLIGAHGQTVRVCSIALEGIRPDGVYFSCLERLSVHDSLEVELVFGDLHRFRATVTITAALEPIAGRGGGERGRRYHYRGEFTEIDRRHYRWIMERVGGDRLHMTVGRP